MADNDVTYVAGHNPYADRFEGEDDERKAFFVITNIGFTQGSKEKHEVYWPIPRDEDELKEFYGDEATMEEAMRIFVMQCTTRPDYKSAGFYVPGDTDPNGLKIAFIGHNGAELLDKEGAPALRPKMSDVKKDSNGQPLTNSEYYGQLKPNGHEAMQSLADAFEIGRRPTASKKAETARKAKAMEEVMAKSGAQSVEDLMALIEKAKALEGQE